MYIKMWRKWSHCYFEFVSLDIEPWLKFDGYSLKEFMIFEWPVTHGYFRPRIKTKEDDLIYKISLHQKEFWARVWWSLCECVWKTPSSKLVPIETRAPGSPGLKSRLPRLFSENNLGSKGKEKWAAKNAPSLQNKLNSVVARFTTYIKPVRQQIRLLTRQVCTRVVKRTTSLFNLFCSDVAKRVARFL